MRKEEFRCPGQNTMFWKPGDIYDVSCPSCGKPVEFWKDEDLDLAFVCGTDLFGERHAGGLGETAGAKGSRCRLPLGA